MAILNMEAVRRNVLPAAIAVVFGVVAWFGVRPLLSDDPAPAADIATAPAADAAPQPVPVAEAPVVYPNVLVASTNVEAGVMLTADMVEWVEWRDGLGLFDDAVVEDKVPMAAVVGAVTLRRVSNGTPVTWGDILMPGHPGFVSAVLGPGMLGMTVEVDRATTSANIIYPGDHVDVIVAMSDDNDVLASRTVLRGVRVLAVGSMVMSPGRYGTVSVTDAGIVEPPPLPRGENYTLEVTPGGAERLALATSAGSLTLAMRAAAADVHPPRNAAPVRLSEVMPSQPTPKPEPSVRVIRGAGTPTEVPA